MLPVCYSYVTRMYPYVLVYEGLNGVNRQPSNGQKSNRQPSKMENFNRQLNQTNLAIKGLKYLLSRIIIASNNGGDKFIYSQINSCTGTFPLILLHFNKGRTIRNNRKGGGGSKKYSVQEFFFLVLLVCRIFFFSGPQALHDFFFSSTDTGFFVSKIYARIGINIIVTFLRYVLWIKRHSMDNNTTYIALKTSEGKV